jgi:hypothetical protein
MLRSLGFQPGAPSADFVHAHHYHSALDADAAAVLGAFEWHHTPLEPADEQ